MERAYAYGSIICEFLPTDNRASREEMDCRSLAAEKMAVGTMSGRSPQERPTALPQRRDIHELPLGQDSDPAPA